MNEKKPYFSQSESFYGTPNLKGLSTEQLIVKTQRLFSCFKSIDFKSGEFKQGFNRQKQLKKLLKLLEIIQYGKDQFPYLLTLQFTPDSYDLQSISFRRDPHYNQGGDLSSVFKGDTLVFPDLFQIKRNPTSFFNAVKSVRERSKESNRKQWEQEVSGLSEQKDWWKGEVSLTIAEQKSLRTRLSLLGNIERAKLLQPDCVCIGGTTDTVLVIGSPIQP